MSQSNSDIAIYKDHCVVYPDGTPAGVPVGQSSTDLPQPYIDFATNHFKPDAAQRHWDASIEWRKQRYDILRNPNDRLRDMERLQPLYIHGVSRENIIVLYEPMRFADLDEMFQNGLTVSHHVERAVYLTEFIRHEVCRGRGRYFDNDDDSTTATKEFKVIYIMDLQDLDIAKFFGGDAFGRLTEFFEIARYHYPGMFQHAWCLNLPRWMTGLARRFLQQVMWGLQPPELMSNKIIDRLSQVIDLDQIPREYGGNSEFALGDHPLHKRYVDFTKQYLQKNANDASTTMTPTSRLNESSSDTSKATPSVSPMNESSDSVSSSDTCEEPQNEQQQHHVNPITALVSTLWLGVWSFWSSVRSLVYSTTTTTIETIPESIQEPIMHESAPDKTIEQTMNETASERMKPNANNTEPTTKKRRNRLSLRRLFRKGRSFETVETTTTTIVS